MAKRMADDDKGTGPGFGHNSEKVDVRIADVMPKIFALEQEIKAVKEEHITPLTKELTKIWQLLKGDTGFPIKYMKSIYQLYKLAEEAKLFEEDDEKNQALDALRISFEALDKGGHLDILKDVLGLDDEKSGDDAEAGGDEETGEGEGSGTGEEFGADDNFGVSDDGDE